MCSKITLQKAYLPSEQKWKTWSVRRVYANEPSGYINWLTNFIQLPSHANRKQPHWESSLEKLQTSQKRHSDHCDYWIQHTHWNCHVPWCHPWHRSPERPHPPGGLSTFYMLQKGQHSNDAHIHDFQQMFERNVKSLTQNIMSGTGLQLSSWEVFRDVGRVFVTLRWKILHSITVSHPHSPHLEFSHLFQPTRALQVIVHNENAPLSFFCRQSPQDMSNCLLSPLFSKKQSREEEEKELPYTAINPCWPILNLA